MADRSPIATPQIRVTIGDNISAETAGMITADAQRRVGTVLDRLRQPVLEARVRVTRHQDPAAANPFTAQANINLNGHLLRAQVTAPTAGEALARLEEKLRHVAERAAARWKDRTGRQAAPAPHEWRHAFPPAERPPYYPRPAAERRVVRHKAFGLAVCTVDEAAVDLAELDYGFHLFTEPGTRQDSVLTPGGADGYLLLQADPRPGAVIRGAIPLTVSEAPAPALTEAEAVSRLDLSGEPFLFFRQPGGARRGQVLYRRYDGHYGLITPAG